MSDRGVDGGPLVVMLLPNHAPFGADWARAAALRVRVVTLELVTSSRLPRIDRNVYSDGLAYEVDAISLRPSRLTMPVSARLQARRVDRALRHITSQHGPTDLLHSHYYHNTRLLRHLRGRPPYVHTEHSVAMIAEDLGSTAHHRLSPAGRRMARRGFADAARVIAVSEYLRRCIRQQFGGAVDVIPNPVDCETFAPGTDRDPHLVTAVGRFSPEKRPELLVRGFAAAYAGDERLRLEWMGSGPQMDRVRALARELGVANAVSFLGHVSRPEVASRVARSRVFLNVSQSETFGVAVAEALAAGVPVVAAHVGALPELVDDESGELVTDCTPEQLGAAILRVANKDFEPDAIARRVRERCSFPVVAEHLARCYDRVLAAPTETR